MLLLLTSSFLFEVKTAFLKEEIGVLTQPRSDTTYWLRSIKSIPYSYSPKLITFNYFFYLLRFYDRILFWMFLNTGSDVVKSFYYSIFLVLVLMLSFYALSSGFGISFFLKKCYIFFLASFICFLYFFSKFYSYFIVLLFSNSLLSCLHLLTDIVLLMELFKVKESFFLYSISFPITSLMQYDS